MPTFAPPQLIVSDIEGCISPAKGHPLELDSLARLQAYNRHSAASGLPPLTLCSGRPQPFVEAFAQMLAVRAPCVCENGALLFDPRADVWLLHPAITSGHLERLAELKTRLERDVAVLIPHRREPGKEVCISLNPIAPPDEYADRIHGLYEALSAYVDSEFFEMTHSASAVDITPKGIDKGAGVRFLSERMGVPLAAMLGIGDTRGDLPFLRLLGATAAPANGQVELDEVISYKAGRPSAGGVCEILAHFTAWSGRVSD